jgi:hypothetical protein
MYGMSHEQVVNLTVIVVGVAGFLIAAGLGAWLAWKKTREVYEPLPMTRERPPMLALPIPETVFEDALLKGVDPSWPIKEEEEEEIVVIE